MKPYPPDEQRREAEQFMAELRDESDDPTPADAEELLAKHGGDHLTIARWLDRWRGDVHRRSEGTADSRYVAGFEAALETAANHLRQGDLLPDGALRDE